jgi:hypothetical protein
VTPQTVQKPVTRRVAKERIEYEPETVVRPVSVQRETYKMEVVTEDVPIQTTRMERVVQKIQVPQRIAKTVQTTEIQLVPRLVTRRIPVDMYGNVIVESALPASESKSSTSLVVPSDATPSPSDTSRSSKKPSTESGELPAPQAKENTSSSDLRIGPAGGDTEATEKPALTTPIDPSTNKPESSTKKDDEPPRIKTQSDD